ncbi:MAG TPA: hypothetical protein VJQ56_15260 [Blastocatellia bacterium]|nr:hypothetical protein [Blastocatellia bacterium]
MTNDEFERAMEFLLQHHAKIDAKLDKNSEQVKQNSEQIERNSRQIAQLMQAVSLHSEQIKTLALQAEADRAETREAINNLIVASEATRELSENVARLAITTSRRVTNLEP